jgi:hypothetical protein
MAAKELAAITEDFESRFTDRPICLNFKPSSNYNVEFIKYDTQELINGWKEAFTQEQTCNKDFSKVRSKLLLSHKLKNQLVGINFENISAVIDGRADGVRSLEENTRNY